jgi:hypothetical protein
LQGLIVDDDGENAVVVAHKCAKRK